MYFANINFNLLLCEVSQETIVLSWLDNYKNKISDKQCVEVGWLLHPRCQNYKQQYPLYHLFFITLTAGKL